MERSHIGNSAISLALTLALSVALAACGKNPNLEAPAGQDAAPQDMPEALTKPKDDWKQIKTFAQSIEGVSFDYDEKSRVAALGFNYRNIDVMGDDGVPVYSYIFALKGKVAEDGTATLMDTRVPDFSARLKCEDKNCGNAEVQITKTSGTIAGVATIRQISLVNIGGLLASVQETQRTTQARFLEEMNGDDPRTLNLVVQEVVGGRKNFFEIRIKFSNSLRLPQDEGYFDFKELRVDGETGENVIVGIGYARSKNLVSQAVRTPYRANVSYDPERAFVGVTFLENRLTKDPEAKLFFGAGRDLYSQEGKK